MIVEQLGLAMIPVWCRNELGLISGIIRGTSGFIRYADELSITIAPELTAIGTNCFATSELAENKA